VRVSPAALLAGAVFLLAAGCGTSAPASPSAGPPTTAPTGTPAATAAPSPSPTRTGDVIEDPSLLDILPEAVDGAAVVVEPDSFTDAAADPAFRESVAAAAFAVVADGTDLASGVVARPVAGRFSEAFFRDWRTTYDEGACGQAGGVAGTAETELGGRTVHITTCRGGLRVYHAYVAERGVIVSLFSMGERRFGERLMEGLRP
jgi:hypothetical protein